MRFAAREGIFWSCVLGAALGSACSADDLAPADDVGDDDATTPDGSVVDAAGPLRDAAGPDASPVQDASVAEVASDADAGEDAARDAGPDATLEEDAGSPADAGEDAATDAGVDAGPPPPALGLLRLEGRWDRTDPTAPRTAYPGSRIVLRFTGTGATLRLLERKSFRSSVGTSQYSVTVDGVPAAILVTTVAADLEEETQDYVVAANLPDAAHLVTLVRRTEADFGSTRLVDVNVMDGSVLPPPARPTRRLEFVGDSNLTGYGIEAERPCLHEPSNQNWSKGFPALVAERFGAEVEAVAHSGKGVFYNSSRADDAVMGVLYPRSIPADPLTAYDPAQFAADAVVVLVGGNDFSLRAAGDYPSVADVQAAYDALIGQIRTAHPTAWITCMISPGINDGYPTYPPGHPEELQSVMVRTKVRAAIVGVVDARTNLGDPRLVFHDVAPAANSDLTACDFHPSPALHQVLATGLGDLLATKLAW